MTDILKFLLQRDRELERMRTRSLARAQWAKVIEVEARLDENKMMRTQLTTENATTNPPAIS